MPLLNRPHTDNSSVHLRPISDGRSSDLWERMRVWRLRCVPVRATLVALLAVALGLWVARKVLPTVSVDEMVDSIRRHADGEGMIAAWMRLCAAQIPLYVLLFCAGLTRFSGALTNGILLVSGMTDGATIALLWYAAGHGSAPAFISVAYLLRAAAETALRVYLSTVACRLARRMDDRDCTGAGNCLQLRLLVRYAAVLALVLSGVSVVCLGYVASTF